MHQVQSNLFARDDTFFGICEALGQDFGFHPNWLRVALAPLLFWNPVATIIGYFGAGVLVLAARLLYPNPRPAAAATGADAVVPAPTVISGEADATNPELVPLAA